MYELLYLCIAVIIINIPLCVGGYVIDKLCPEDDKEVLEYEKYKEQVQERKRAAKQRKSRKA